MRVGLLVMACFMVQDKDKGTIAVETNLQTLTETVQARMKKRFMFTEDLKLKDRKVYFLSRGVEVTDDDLFRIYQAMLQMHGLALIPTGEKGKEIYKITLATQPGPQANKIYPPIIDKIETPKDEFVIRVFKLKHISVSEIQLQLRQLGLQNIMAIEQSGILLITDYDHNIQKFEEIIKLADVPREDIKMKVVQIKNSLAPDITKMLQQIIKTILQTPTATGGAMPRLIEKIEIVEDTRTNSLILLAPEARLKQLEEIIEELDKKSPYETVGIFTYQLRYAIAKDAVSVLNQVFRITSSSTGTAPTTPTTPTPTLTRTLSIVADDKTNSIIVITDRNTFRMIEDFLGKIDKRRPQVLIKATAVEIEARDDFELGVELNRALEKFGKASLVARQNMGLSTLRDTNNDGIPEIVPADTTGVTLAIFREKIGNIPFLMNMIENKAQISVHDEPELITDDNVEGKISISDEVPYKKSNITVQGPTQVDYGFSTAKTDLTIKPHITDFQQLSLDITIAIEKFGSPPEIGAPPPKTTRNLKGTVNIYNGMTVVIGGVVTQTNTENVRGTPFLASIPVLGELFKKQRRDSIRKTLYIFITPYILYDEKFGDIYDLSKDRRDTVNKLRKEKLNLTFDQKQRFDPIPSFRFIGPNDIERGK